MALEFGLEIGKTYIYIGEWPPGCKGHRYRIERLVMDVPTYQEKVLVVALSGPDEGLWFTCSPWNFSTRYRRST